VLLEELQLKHDTETLKAIMRRSVPSTMQDVVLVFVTVSGLREGGTLVQEVFARKIFAERSEAGAAVGDPDHHRRRHLRRGRPVPRRPAAAARLRAPGAGAAAGLPGQPLRPRLPAVAPGREHRLSLCRRAQAAGSPGHQRASSARSASSSSGLVR
jgi:hypothetical protein